MHDKVEKEPQLQAPHVQASNWEGIVGNDISRISTNVDNLAASFHDLVMENKMLVEQRDELLAENHQQASHIKELTLELKLIGEKPKQAEANDSGLSI